MDVPAKEMESEHIFKNTVIIRDNSFMNMFLDENLFRNKKDFTGDFLYSRMFFPGIPFSSQNRVSQELIEEDSLITNIKELIDGDLSFVPNMKNDLTNKIIPEETTGKMESIDSKARNKQTYIIIIAIAVILAISIFLIYRFKKRSK